MRSDSQRQRIMDKSAQLARAAVAETIERFTGWRQAVVHMRARAERELDAGVRQALLSRCAAIEAEVREARTLLIIELADAPQKVNSNSRIVDIERAFDELEGELNALRSSLVASDRRE